MWAIIWVSFTRLILTKQTPKAIRCPVGIGANCLGSGSVKAKCRDNLAALELLKCIEADDRRPTPADKRAMVWYVGWEGLPQVFDSRNDEWSAERERLEQLLTAVCN